MTGHRIVYGAALCCCLLFYAAYGQWLSAIVLAAVLGLPWLSLAMTLPAICTFQWELHGPRSVTQGEEGDVYLSGSSRFPMPPFRGGLAMTDLRTGKTLRGGPNRKLPADHCGGYLVRPCRTRVCDYLGLFALPLGRKKGQTFLVQPRPQAVKVLPELTRHLSRAWRPKYGGGFSERHELRLYRPGDSLNQVHWKLSAKTGSLTLREPVEAVPGLMLLTMTLRGTPEVLDRKLGRLLWLGRRLLERDAEFEVRTLTGAGIQYFQIRDEAGLNKAIDSLLCAPAAREGSIRSQSYQASWQYHIGGDADEGQ